MPIERFCLTFTGVLTNALTGERVDATFTFVNAEDGTGALEVDVHGRRTDHQFATVHSVRMRALVVECFGPPPDGNRVPSFRSPANINGTPRNRLRDRLRDRMADKPEVIAAD